MGAQLHEILPHTLLCLTFKNDRSTCFGMNLPIWSSVSKGPFKITKFLISVGFYQAPNNDRDL